MVGAAGVVVSVTVALAGPADARVGEAPGTVTDRVELAGRLRVQGATTAERLTYWSRGPRGPMQSTGVLYLPEGSPPQGGWPIIAYAHGTSGIADECAFTVHPRDYYLTSVFPALLGAGYAVVISDYVGLGTPGVHPYLDGPSEARSIIDGVRAARAIAPSLGTRWAVFGQSQGGQAALFTAHLAPGDAPELDLRGAAATGTPSNLDRVFPLAGPWLPRLPLQKTTTYFAMLLAGLRDSAPELDIDGYLTPVGRDVLRIVETECATEADAQVSGIGIGAMLSRPLDDPALLAAVRTMLRVPTSGYSVPLYLGQGVTDLEVPAPLTLELVAELHASGTDLRVGWYPGDHLGAAREAFPDALTFLSGVLDRP
ncbi:lipase [Streptomyces gardneri]|uniref:lipase family protein n=1 Tax=Nocardia TaxID=1817 RepID=UPI00135CB538|nr:MULTISPECIES: lipase family protein [Nocardia]MBF6167865.1 lipase [Streptomyces gardneri]MBF6206248.1 lipase [Streptomyces gardneri]UAK31568.1 lipase family protein [Nocardia asteroides]